MVFEIGFSVNMHIYTHATGLTAKDYNAKAAMQFNDHTHH